MGTEPNRLEARHRSARMLHTALGDAIAEWLADPQMIEIMLNTDGRLWVDRLGEGIAESGQIMTAAEGEQIIRLGAHPSCEERGGRKEWVSTCRSHWSEYHNNKITKMKNSKKK